TARARAPPARRRSPRAATPEAKAVSTRGNTAARRRAIRRRARAGRPMRPALRGPPPTLRSGLGCARCQLALGGIARWLQPWAAQGVEERHQRGHLRRAQAGAVRRHVAAALHDLADHVIVVQARRDRVQLGTTAATYAPERMAGPALLVLNQQRALA